MRQQDTADRPCLHVSRVDHHALRAVGLHVGDEADQVAVVLEGAADEMPDRILVIHDQDIRLAHEIPPFVSSGNSTQNVAPQLSSLCTVSAPAWRWTMS